MPMSESACPANDWPRMTVNTPTIPETTAAIAPTTRATWTGSEEKNPGSNSEDQKSATTITPSCKKGSASPGWWA